VYRHDGRPRGVGILTAWLRGQLAPNVRRTVEQLGVVRPPQRGVARLLDGMEADEHHGFGGSQEERMVIAQPQDVRTWIEQFLTFERTSSP
jgi:hypothetical protein